MLKAARIRREESFEFVRQIYEQEILTYNITGHGLLKYMVSYLNIASTFEVLHVSRDEVRYRLGDKFEKWFFVTHNEIVENFWEGVL